MTFGFWLQNERKRKGISARELCRRINKSSNYICGLENGRTLLPSKEAAIAIFEELEVANSKELIQQFGIANDVEIEQTKSSINEQEVLLEKIQNHLPTLDATQVKNLSLFFEHPDLFDDVRKILELQKKNHTKFPIKHLKKTMKFLISDLEESIN